jgi:hypothetical protein
MRCVPPKRQFIFTGLHMSQMIELFTFNVSRIT